MKTPESQTFSLLLSMLSEADQKFIREDVAQPTTERVASAIKQLLMGKFVTIDGIVKKDYFSEAAL